jgi:hypothetical protein
MENHQPTNDSTTLIATPQPEARQLSQYANALDFPKPGPDTAAQNALHPLEIADSGKPAGGGIYAFAHEVATDPSQAISDTRNAISGVAGAIENLYEHPGQIADAAKSALNTAENSKVATFINDFVTEGPKDKLQLTPAGRGMVALGEYGGF